MVQKLRKRDKTCAWVGKRDKMCAGTTVWGQTLNENEQRGTNHVQCVGTNPVQPHTWFVPFLFWPGDKLWCCAVVVVAAAASASAVFSLFCCCQNQSSGTDFALKQGQGDKTCEVATKIKKPSILTHKLCPPGCFGQGTNVVRESGDKCHMEVAKGAQSLCGSCKKGQNLGS